LVGIPRTHLHANVKLGKDIKVAVCAPFVS